MAFKNTKNNTKQSIIDYFVSGKSIQYHSAQFGENIDTTLTGLEASGGTISDFVDGGSVYRAHIFTTTGTFLVSRLSTTISNDIEYLVVAGGGGGGGHNGQSGGGGAGGLRTNLTGHPLSATTYTASTGAYTVVVGGGGAGGAAANTAGTAGANSEFYKSPDSWPGTAYIRSHGGGAGMGYVAAPVGEMDGGSGGGATCSPNPYAAGSGNTLDPNHPQPQGNPGGTGTPAYGSPYAGGGGGGAGRQGAPDDPATPLTRSTGGYGVQVLIAHNPANSVSPIGTPGPDSNGGYFAGGGGGGRYSGTSATGGYGGGADGAPPSDNRGNDAVSSTGGGGGGGGYTTSYGRGGNGASGIVVVRYKIAELTATARATGGAISFHNGKTIHQFTSSGTLSTNQAITNVEYIVIAGGGGGGSFRGGGGGAGGYRSSVQGESSGGGASAEPTINMGSGVNYTIQVGAGGAGGSDESNGPLGWGNYGGQSSISGPDITTISCTGGGFGRTDDENGEPGGSGGGSGGGAWGGAGGTGTANQGYAGGDPSGPNSYGNSASGGGGAGGIGSPASGSTWGAGGAGVESSITGSPVVRASGGGGGSGSSVSEPATPGGGGKGGDSNDLSTDNLGQANTGGGGGGGNTSASGGGAGGSGIVIIAYPS